MNYTFGAHTDPGRVRTDNEDAVDFDPVSERLAAAGFRIETLDQNYLPGAFRFIGFNSRGVASPV